MRPWQVSVMCLSNKIVESQDNSGWKEPLEDFSSTSEPKQGQQWDQTRFLRALSIWVLENSKNSNCAISVQLTPMLTYRHGKKA